MKIIIDAMGGDNAPLAPLQGAAQAVRELGVSILAVGDEAKLREVMAQNGIDAGGIEIRHASDVIGMDEDATDVVRSRPDSSLAVATRLLAAGEGDALVSAGATGALLVGATMIVKRIRGIRRPAIGTVMPGVHGPWLLIDGGANVEARAEMMVQFAAMGTAYMEGVMGIQRPTVGLANNGTEPTKGTKLQIDAYPLLQSNSGLNFVGNVEARDIPTGDVNVVVCDGFTGNIILKQTEGVAKMITGMLKDALMANLKTKIAALLLKKELDGFKKKMDYKEHGGAPLLGVRKTVIKAHGSSDAKAIKNAIRQAKTCVENDVPASIEKWMAQHGVKSRDE